MKFKSYMCCVANCGSRRRNIMLHKFPSTETGLQKWLECINSDDLRRLTFCKLMRTYVCHKHFEKKWFTSASPNSRIRMGAYPTLFTEQEIRSGIPQNRSRECLINYDHDYTTKTIHQDHSYCKKLPTPEVIVPDVFCQNHDGDVNIKTIETDPVVSTPRISAQRKRVISSKKSLTPNCRHLYSEYCKSRKQLSFTKRVKRCLKFSKEQSFEKLTENMNPLAKKLLWIQVNQCTRKVKGRRFSDEEKLISLSIMKQSPKSYRFLRKIFILPSKQVLNKMISELHVEAGINTQIFDAIKQEVHTWVENKKYCSIMFDEVALETALAYDKDKDVIDGFVELNNKCKEFADHALVFMLRGAVYKWQQPIAFYFCKGATSGLDLKGIMKKIVTAVSATGLLPIALVCDQGSAFQSSLKSLQEDTKRKYILEGKTNYDEVIEIEGNEISVLYDPPHLIKGIRNNFLTKNIVCEKKISKWSDIIDIYKIDCNHSQMRLLHKLTDEHVIPEKIKKMKVKNCTKVLSKTVAATLSYTAQYSHYPDGTPVSSTLSNTAEIVAFFDDLFDSVNGASLMDKHGKSLRKAVTEKSVHHKFWQDAIVKLENIKYVNSCGKEISVPSLKNFVTTIKSLQRLWQFFKSKNIKIMRPRYFNSDPIENFFGQVRAYSFRSNDPSCHSFKNIFRSLLITRFIKFHSDTYNCEDVTGEQLLKLTTLFKKVHTESNNDTDVAEYKSLLLSYGDCSPEHSTSSQNESSATASQERIKIHSRAYTAGWVTRKVLQKFKCDKCTSNLTVPKEDLQFNKLNTYILYREFKTIKKDKLTYPSENTVKAFGEIINKCLNKLESEPHIRSISFEIKNELMKSKTLFNFLDCELHREAVADYFMSLTVRLNIFNWCTVINKILKGTDVFRLPRTLIPNMQARAFDVYSKKLKNKNKHK